MAECRKIMFNGEVYAEYRFPGEMWNGWCFPTSKVPKDNYQWEESVGLYRRNTSASGINKRRIIVL